jgi:hypothetical protein
MKNLMRILAALIVSVLVAAIAASVFSTQFVITGLQELGVSIPLDVRLKMTVSDLSILQTLLIVFAVCFLVAFSVGVFASRKIGGDRTMWLCLAGGIGVIATLLLLQSALQVMPIAGARSSFGLIMQGVAGAFGGYAFARLTETSQSIQ